MIVLEAKQVTKAYGGRPGLVRKQALGGIDLQVRAGSSSASKGRREAGRPLELGTLFLLPRVFGAAHTAFALKTVSNLIDLHLNIVGVGLMIGAAYLTDQTVYFLITRTAYVWQVTATWGGPNPAVTKKTERLFVFRQEAGSRY